MNSLNIMVPTQNANRLWKKLDGAEAILAPPAVALLILHFIEMAKNIGSVVITSTRSQCSQAPFSMPADYP